MPFVYKINVLAELKKKGFNTNTIRQNKLLAESTVQKIRHQQPVSWDNLETICRLLNCQPGDIIEYVEDAE